MGTNFEPLGPTLEQKAADIGYDPVGKGKLGRNPEDVDEDGDSEMTESADDSDGKGNDSDGVADNSDFVKLHIGSKIPRFASVANDKAPQRDASAAVESNPYFVVDVEPTPVNLSEPIPEKKSRKQLKDEAFAERKAARELKKQAVEAAKAAAPKEPTPEPESEVDFAELEATLQAEIAAGTKAQEEAEAKEEKKSKKKRRRSSGVEEEVVGKKAKVEKKEKKRKAEECDDVEEAKKVKEEKKKEKKRKADDSADGDEVEEGTKKKKHRSDA